MQGRDEGNRLPHVHRWELTLDQPAPTLLLLHCALSGNNGLRSCVVPTSDSSISFFHSIYKRKVLMARFINRQKDHAHKRLPKEKYNNNTHDLLTKCWHWRSLQPNTPARALDAQEVSQDLQRSKRRSITGVTDLVIDRADVELVLGQNGSRTTPGRIHRGEARGGSPRTSKAS
jgi:hypothetical protein